MRNDYSDAYWAIGSNSNIVVLYNWYIRNCESLNLPYHNLSHTLGMMTLITKLYKFSQFKKDYGFKLSDEDFYLLMVSALFHDYNHSGGKFDDETNVGIAISGLEECLNGIFKDDMTTRYIFEKCSEIIKATQYPYVIADSDLTLLQRIIRECDILVCFYDDFITHNVFGLWKEMNTGLDIVEYAGMYYRFITEALQSLKLKFSQDIIKENQDEFFTRFNSFAGLIAGS